MSDKESEKLLLKELNAIRLQEEKKRLAKSRFFIPDVSKIPSAELEKPWTIVYENVETDVYFDHPPNKDFLEITKALKNNTVLKSFTSCRTFQRDDRGPAWCTAVMEGFMNHPRIETINLELCGMDDLGGDKVGEFLKSNKSCKILYLNGCNIGPLGAESISKGLDLNTKLMLLSLERVPSLGAQGVISIAKSLANTSSLTELDLKSTLCGDDAIIALAEALVSNKSLVKVNLSECKATPECIAPLMSSIASHPTLKWLILRCNPLLEGTGVSILCKYLNYTRIKGLNLENCKINDDGALILARTLAENQTLKSLHLRDNPIGDVGIEAILKAVVHIPGLFSLDLSKLITKTPVTWPSKYFADFLGANCSVQIIQFPFPKHISFDSCQSAQGLENMRINTNLGMINCMLPESLKWTLERNQDLVKFSTKHREHFPLLSNLVKVNDCLFSFE